MRLFSILALTLALINANIANAQEIAVPSATHENATIAPVAEKLPPSPPAPPIDKPMSFTFAANGQTCINCYWIAAEGNITPETPAEFKQFLEEIGQKQGNFTVYLHSSGGDILAATALGQVIRNAGFNTATGSTHWVKDRLDATIKRGQCDDACLWAFLGGNSRSAKNGSLSLHTYRPPLEEAGTISRMEADIRKQQLADIAYVFHYAQKMGFNAELMFVDWKKNQPHRFTRQEYQNYKITYEPQTFGPWALEPAKRGLKAVTTSHNGQSTISFYCDARKRRYFQLQTPAIFNADIYESLFGNVASYNVFGLKVPASRARYKIENNKLVVTLRVTGFRAGRITDTARFIINDKTTAPDPRPSMLFEPQFSDMKSLKQLMVLTVRNCI